jgi:hypothetical protein
MPDITNGCTLALCVATAPGTAEAPWSCILIPAPPGANYQNIGNWFVEARISQGMSPEQAFAETCAAARSTGCKYP